MLISTAKYTEQGSILAVIDGQEMTVPDDLANRHRVLLAEWEAGGNVIEPYAEPIPDLSAYTAEKRWQKETGGFTFNGLHIATDDRSKLLISGAREAAKADPDFTTPWVTATGEIAMLDAVAVIALSNAVAAHVNNVFGIYSQLLPQIADGSITDTAQIDAAFA